jgi:DNA-damage-inducible protein D
MLGQRGIKPEKLAAEEDLKKLERRVRTEEKKLANTTKTLPSSDH